MNYLKANPEKSQLLITSKDTASIKIHGTDINGWSKKLLEVFIDSKLTFNEHGFKVCKTASDKLHALHRISKCMTKDKVRAIINPIFFSLFAYFALVWMFHNRTLNNKINKLQEPYVKFIMTIHHRIIQKIALEMYRVKHLVSSKNNMGII